MTLRNLIICGILLFASCIVYGLEDGNCSVCVKVIKKLREDITKDGGKLTAEKVSNSFLELCEAADVESTEAKFCYYMGGQKVSATRTYKEMAEKMANDYPPEKICEQLQLKDSQICEIKEKIPTDLKTIDLKTLKVADLKKLLKERKESCDACFEKSEFIKKIEEIKARDEL